MGIEMNYEIGVPCVVQLHVVVVSTFNGTMEKQEKIAKVPRNCMAIVYAISRPFGGEHTPRSCMLAEQGWEPREYLRCAQCGPAADAHWASTDGGLMQRMGQNHGGQTLLEDSVGQLRWLRCAQSDRSGVAGVSRAGSTLFSANFPLETPSRTDDSPGIRTQRPAVRHAVSNSLRARRSRHQRL